VCTLYREITDQVHLQLAHCFSWHPSSGNVNLLLLYEWSLTIPYLGHLRTGHGNITLHQKNGASKSVEIPPGIVFGHSNSNYFPIDLGRIRNLFPYSSLLMSDCAVASSYLPEDKKTDP
jgi:hypothetical protein